MLKMIVMNALRTMKGTVIDFLAKLDRTSSIIKESQILITFLTFTF